MNVGNLREYLFRDDELIQQFLEQLLDGEAYETQVTAASNRGVSAGVRAPGLDIGGSKGSTKQVVQNIKATATSRASQLQSLLSDDTGVLAAMDDEAWDQVSVGEFVQASGELHLPEVIKMILMLSDVDLAGFESVLEGDRLKELQAMRGQVSQISDLRGMIESGGVPAVMKVNDGGPNIVVIVRPSLLRTAVTDLDQTTVTVFGRVSETLRRGDTKLFSQILPQLMSALPSSPQNRAQRRRSGSRKSADDVVLDGPGAVIRPISLYR